MPDIFERFIVDPLIQARRCGLLAQLLELPDEPAMPRRGVRVRYALPVNRQALLAWLSQAHTQHRLLEARGEG